MTARRVADRPPLHITQLTNPRTSTRVRAQNKTTPLTMSLKIMGFGNPLLDISAVVEQDEMDK